MPSKHRDADQYGKHPQNYDDRQRDRSKQCQTSGSNSRQVRPRTFLGDLSLALFDSNDKSKKVSKAEDRAHKKGSSNTREHSKKTREGGSSSSKHRHSEPTSRHRGTKPERKGIRDGLQEHRRNHRRRHEHHSYVEDCPDEMSEDRGSAHPANRNEQYSQSDYADGDEYSEPEPVNERYERPYQAYDPPASPLPFPSAPPSCLHCGTPGHVTEHCSTHEALLARFNRLKAGNPLYKVRVAAPESQTTTPMEKFHHDLVRAGLVDPTTHISDIKVEMVKGLLVKWHPDKGNRTDPGGRRVAAGASGMTGGGDDDYNKTPPPKPDI